MFRKKSKKILTIEGMKCEKCSLRVSNILTNIDNITKVKVNLEDKKVVITYFDSLSDEIIKSRLEEAGYKVIDIKNDTSR